MKRAIASAGPRVTRPLRGVVISVTQGGGELLEVCRHNIDRHKLHYPKKFAEFNSDSRRGCSQKFAFSAESDLCQTAREPICRRGNVHRLFWINSCAYSPIEFAANG